MLLLQWTTRLTGVSNSGLDVATLHPSLLICLVGLSIKTEILIVKISMISHHLKNRVSVPLILAFNFLYIFIISYISYAFLQIEYSNYIDKSVDFLSPTHTNTRVFAASLCPFCYTLECFSHLSNSHPTIYTITISSWTNFFGKAILVLPFYTDYAVSLFICFLHKIMLLQEIDHILVIYRCILELLWVWFQK